MRQQDSISTDEPLVERIAEEILERQRAGEHPTVEEYCQQYPEHAEELRNFLPALLVVEGLKPSSKDISGTFGGEFDVEGKRREFIGDYRILRKLGRGGMGVVYEAEQQSLGRHVALKVLLRSVAGDARAAKRFESEAKAAARMHHTNIVPVFDVGSDDQHLFYAMQLIQGQAIDLVIDDLKQLRNLRNRSTAAHTEPKAADKSIARSLVAGQFHQDQLLDQTQDCSQAGTATDRQPIEMTETLEAPSTSNQSAVLPGQRELSSAENNRPSYFLSVARIGHQTAEALAYAHARGIIHRDIKPSNLLLDGNGIVWITDFGLAKTGDHGMTHTGDILGTVRYMSPERFKGQCDVRADVYALGLTLYELLTLQPAFSAADQLKLIDKILHNEPPTPRSLDPNVPRDLETIVLKCIDKDPRRRYQSADELNEDLGRFIQDEPIRAHRISFPERVTRWSRRNRGIAASLAVAGTLLLILNIAGPLVTWRMSQLKNKAIRAEAEARQAELVADQRADEALHAELLAGQRAETINRNLYLANMNLASVAAQMPGGIARVAMLTDAWTPQPNQTSPDPRGWEWFYLRSLMHRDQHTLEGHNQPLSQLKWSSDGKRLASASTDGQFIIWDAENGQQVQIGQPVENSELQIGPRLAFNPDLTQLVTGVADNMLKIWNVSGSEELVAEAPSFQGNQYYGFVAWSPDGTLIASTGRDGVIEVWDVSTGQTVSNFHPGFATMSIAWSPNGERLALGGVFGTRGQRRGQLVLWDAVTDEPGQTLDLPIQANYITSVAWSPDGNRVVATYPGENISMWDTRTGELFSQLKVNGSGLSVAWSPDGTRLAAGLATRVISVWDANAIPDLRLLDPENRARIYHDFEPSLFLQGHTARRVYAVAWSPDSARLASGCQDTAVKIWDIDQLLTEKALAETSDEHRHASSLAWSSEGQLLKVASKSNGLEIWNTESDQLLWYAHAESEFGLARVVSLSPDRQFVAIASPVSIEVWNTESGSLHTSWDLETTPHGIAWCPDSILLASRSFQEDAVRIYNIETGETLESQEGHIGGARSLAWSPQGRQLASGGNVMDKKIKLWDANTGQSLGTLEGHRSYVSALAWSSDGSALASGDEDNLIFVWDVKAQKPKKVLSGHVEPISALAWSPDEQRLASAGRDDKLIVWDPVSGQEAFSMGFDIGKNSGHVTWSPDGKRLAAIFHGRIKIMDARKGYAEEAERVQHHDPTIDSASHQRGLRTIVAERSAGRSGF